jgi:hypothetical protein
MDIGFSIHGTSFCISNYKVKALPGETHPLLAIRPCISSPFIPKIMEVAFAQYVPKLVHLILLSYCYPSFFLLGNDLVKVADA